MKSRLPILAGVVAYTLSALTATYALAFLGNRWLPRTIDGPATRCFGGALAINVAQVIPLRRPVHRFIFAACIVFAWAAPTMTVTRLVFALGLTVCVLLAADLRKSGPPVRPCGP